jgi:hypothetical protein
MTNDETHRKMDLMAAQQAQYRADMQRLKQSYSRAAKRFAKTEKIVAQVEREILRLKKGS